jgi:hypothetical protein
MRSATHRPAAVHAWNSPGRDDVSIAVYLVQIRVDKGHPEVQNWAHFSHHSKKAYHHKGLAMRYRGLLQCSPQFAAISLLPGTSGAQGLQNAPPPWNRMRPCVLAKLSLRISLGQAHKDVLSRRKVLLLARPRLQCARLQCTAIREREAPGSIRARSLQRLHSVKRSH